MRNEKYILSETFLDARPATVQFSSTSEIGFIETLHDESLTFMIHGPDESLQFLRTKVTTEFGVNFAG